MDYVDDELGLSADMLSALKALDKAIESKRSIEAILDAHYDVQSVVKSATDFSVYLRVLSELSVVWRESDNTTGRQEAIWNIGEEVSERIAMSEISRNQESIDWGDLSEIIHESLLRE